MKKFRGTIFFAIIVIAVGFFAIQEYRKGEIEESTKSTKANIVKDYKSSDVVSFSFKGAGSMFELKRDGNKWSVLTPVTDAADDQAVDSAISQLFSQNVEALEADGEKIESSQYGLSSPLAEYNFSFSDGKKLKIVVGTVRSYDKGFYLQKDNGGDVLVSGPGWESIIAKNADHFRSKKINIEDGQLTKLNIVSKVKDKAVNLNFELEDNHWVNVKNKNIKLSDAKVIEFFNKIRQLRAEGFAANDSEAPTLTKNKFSTNFKIEGTVKTSENKTQEFVLSFKVDEDSSALLLANVNKPLYKIPKSKINDLIQNLDYFRDKKYPFQFDLTKSSSIEIKTNANLLNFKKKNDVWVDSIDQTVKVNQEEIKSLLSGLIELEGKEFFVMSKILNTQSKFIEIKNNEGQIVFTLRYAETAKPDEYKVETNLASESMLINKASLDSLVNKKLIEMPKTEGKK